MDTDLVNQMAALKEKSQMELESAVVRAAVPGPCPLSVVAVRGYGRDICISRMAGYSDAGRRGEFGEIGRAHV